MELILGLVGAGLIYLGLSVWAWAFAARHAAPSAQRKPDWVFRPAWIILGWVLLVGVLPVLYRMIQSPLTNLINTVWLLTAITLPLCILIVSLVIWIRAGSLAAHPARYRLIGLAALVAGIVIDAAFMGCLLLWALGIIAMYESALLIAVIISISILVLVVIVMRRGLRLALSGFGPAGG